MEHFAKIIINGYKSLSIFAKCSILEVGLGSQYASLHRHFYQPQDNRLNLLFPGNHYENVRTTNAVFSFASKSRAKGQYFPV